MNKTFGLLYYVKRAKLNNDGLAPIYLRVTINRARIEISSKRYIKPDQWNKHRQKVSGTSDDVRSLNAYLKTLEHQVYDEYHTMVQNRLQITAVGLKKRLFGEDERPALKMLIPIFEEHNNKVKALVGKEFAKGTLERYETSLKHTKNFLLWKYKSNDIAIDHEFVNSYDFYFRSERNCNNNSTVKYLKNFKKIILICIANGWLDKDRFLKYKPKVKEVKREFLNPEELITMAKKKIVSDRVSQVRDIFLFSCYTGLAYADVKKLKRSEVVTGIDGQKWIYTSRQKTDTESRIPLLPQALELIKKYEDPPSMCE